MFRRLLLTLARLLFPDSVEDELELSAVRHRPEGLEQLESQTRFSRKELQILYRGFKNVRDGVICWFCLIYTQADSAFSGADDAYLRTFYFLGIVHSAEANQVVSGRRQTSI